MLVLEARFHSGPRDQAPSIVVGHVVWSDDGDAHPIVRPASSLVNQDTPATLLSKLQYLVTTTAPDSFHRLQGLHSVFWSFVDVSPE